MNKRKQTSFVVNEELLEAFNQKYKRLLSKFLTNALKMAVQDVKFAMEVLLYDQSTK